MPEDARRGCVVSTFVADPLRPSTVSLGAGRRAPRVLARLASYDDDAAPGSAPRRSALSACARTGPRRSRLPRRRFSARGGTASKGAAPDRFRWADSDAVHAGAVGRARGAVEVAAAPADRRRGRCHGQLARQRHRACDAAPVTLARERRLSLEGAAGVWLAGTNELLFSTLVRHVRREPGHTRSGRLRSSACELPLDPCSLLP